jgi:NAD(P)-dependent dehydrogenase (short-subunit alcohol dehydrogenase family)
LVSTAGKLPARELEERFMPTLLLTGASSGIGRATAQLFAERGWNVAATESLGFELEPHGIRVKIVEPGPIKTSFYDRSMDLAKKPGLTAYDGFVAKAMPNLQAAGAKAPGPERVARVIWKAATDGSRKLRYPANSAPLLALRRLLPERVFLAIVKSAVLR